MHPRDIALFVRSARTDARIEALRPTLGAAGTIEAIDAADPDPWASASPGYRYQRRKYEVIASLLPAGRFERALDLGCGTGLLSGHLGDRADEVVGVDLSPPALAVAGRRHAGRAHIRFEAHDPLRLPDSFDGTFDLVVVADVLSDLMPLDAAVLASVAGRIARLLRPGGVSTLANHYVLWVDSESRRSRRIHDAFRSAGPWTVEAEHRPPFDLVTVLRNGTGPASKPAP